MSILDLVSGEDQLVKPGRPVVGVVPGIVTNNKDPENLGRVKVKFPWLSDQNEFNWARVASAMAGKQMGSFFLPEVNDEVLVCFEHGNLNSPYVIGALWNGKAGPPETNKDGKNNIRKIKSRSGHEIIFDDTKQKEKLEIKTKAGHQLVLDDTSGKEQLFIKTKTGHKLLMDDKSGKEQICIQSKGGHKFLLDDSSGQEKVLIQDKSGSNKILIDSAQKAVKIESGMKLDIKSTKINIEASAELKLKGAKVIVEGAGMLEVKSGGILSVKGSLVKIN